MQNDIVKSPQAPSEAEKPSDQPAPGVKPVQDVIAPPAKQKPVPTNNDTQPAPDKSRPASDELQPAPKTPKKPKSGAAGAVVLAVVICVLLVGLAVYIHLANS